MKVTSITASRSCKVRPRSYESIDAFFSITVELEPGDSLQSIIDSAWATAQQEVQNQEQIMRQGDDTMPIVGLTDRPPEFPEIGIIRKGAPKPKGEKRPGKDLDHFRLDTDDESARKIWNEVYGAEPRSLRIMLPSDNTKYIFDPWIEAYKASGMVLRTDGETIDYPRERAGEPYNPEEWKKYNPKATGRLKVMVVEMQRAAYLTVKTTSVYDIGNLSSQLRQIKELAGRLTGIPMVLRRVEKSVKTPEGRFDKWLIHIEIDPAWVAAKMAALQAEALPSSPAQLGLPASISAAHFPEDDYDVDEQTGEVVEGAVVEETPHWIANEKARKRFWTWTKGDLQLTELQVHEALGADSVYDYAGSMQDAKEALEQYVAQLADNGDEPENLDEWFPESALLKAVQAHEMIAINGAQEEAAAAINKARAGGVDVENGAPEEIAERIAQQWADTFAAGEE